MSGLRGSEAATAYLCRIMVPDDTLAIKNIVRRLHYAPSEARQYLQRNCTDVSQLEAFLKEHLYLFFVENKKVALQDDRLENARDEAVHYFKEAMKYYKEPMHYMQIKEQHIDQVHNDVAEFLVRFYPIKEFKDFFKSRPNIFVLHKNETVSLVKMEAVNFFQRRLKLYENYGPFNVFRLRGHVSQAPEHVQKFINNYYVGNSFEFFLRENNNVFKLKNGIVSLMN